MSLVCDKLDINIWEMLELANCHPRVNILQPGPGVGGHCIAVDPWFIVDSAPELTPLIRAARSVNARKPDTIVEKILSSAEGAKASIIGFLGLAYKANIDDLRESPAVEIVQKITGTFNGQIVVCEPNIRELPTELSFSKKIRLASLNTCLKDAEIIVLLTDHREFEGISPNTLVDKLIIDTRGLWGHSKD